MDRRETILRRIATVCVTTGAVVKRMAVDLHATERPAIVVNDGDETIQLNKGGKAPMIVTLRPQLILVVQGEEPGTLINTLRAKVLKALLTDTILAGLLSPHGTIRYIGLETQVARGETLEADMALNFEATYLLDPSEI